MGETSEGATKFKPLVIDKGGREAIDDVDTMLQQSKVEDAEAKMN